MPVQRPTPARIIAMGDSFAEGMGDYYPDGTPRGWVDRCVAKLGAFLPDIQYANHAIRGTRLPEIAQQLDAVIDLRPDLVIVSGGVNDILHPRVDIPATADRLEHIVATLTEAQSTALLTCVGDPRYRSRIIGLVGQRLAEFNEHVRRIARTYDSYLMDFWPERVFDAPQFWADDRLHLSELGHEFVAQAALQSLGYPHAEWRTYRHVTLSWGSKRVSDIQWTREHFTPWLIGRIRGQRSAYTATAKYPSYVPVSQLQLFDVPAQRCALSG